jgi:hypothetical protein
LLEHLRGEAEPALVLLSDQSIGADFQGFHARGWAFSPHESKIRSKRPLYNRQNFLRRAAVVKYPLRAWKAGKQKKNWRLKGMRRDVRAKRARDAIAASESSSNLQRRLFNTRAEAAAATRAARVITSAASVITRATSATLQQQLLNSR